MSILFWLAILLVLIGDGLFVYGSVELINHNSKKDVDKLYYWGGLILQILAFIWAMYLLFRDTYRKTSIYKNNQAYKNEVNRLGKDAYTQRANNKLGPAPVAPSKGGSTSSVPTASAPAT